LNYKIIYFAFIGDKLDGVTQKIIAQFDALSAVGADIYLFLVSSFTPGETLALEIKKRSGVNILVNSHEKIRNPWYRRKEKFDLISSVLSGNSPKNTIVYFRYPLSDIIFLRFLKKNKVFTFVTEHQEIENIFAKSISNGRFFRSTLELLWGKQVRKLIKGYVGVTEEITAFERTQVNNKHHYFKTIGNGVDMNKYPLRIPKKNIQNNEIRILFVGSGYRHHGLARLINSIDMYYKNKNNAYKINVKVAGDSIEMNENKNLVKKLKLCSMVSFLGNLENVNLDEHFNWAQVGMASMGLHRVGLSKSSTLKTREYFARGLPFFWSSTDDDFPLNYPYILKFESDDSAFDISEVISFIERISRDESYPQKMRHYSIEHLSWSVKIKELITFFDEIIEAIH
jgi:glycosyltransferase involved in cell wall biosynthesis